MRICSFIVVRVLAVLFAIYRTVELNVISVQNWQWGSLKQLSLAVCVYGSLDG